MVQSCTISGLPTDCAIARSGPDGLMVQLPLFPPPAYQQIEQCQILSTCHNCRLLSWARSKLSGNHQKSHMATIAGSSIHHD